MNNIYVTQVAQSVPFDNASNGLVATEVQSAIEEVLAISNFSDFSWNRVDRNVTIMANRQMLCYQEVEVLGTNEIDIVGELVILE